MLPLTIHYNFSHSNGTIWLTWGLHPLVVVRVDADFVLLEVKGILTGLNGTQLVVAVKVWPSPQTAVDNMGKALPVGDLETAVQGSDWTANRRRWWEGQNTAEVEGEEWYIIWPGRRGNGDGLTRNKDVLSNRHLQHYDDNSPTSKLYTQ